MSKRLFSFLALCLLSSTIVAQDMTISADEVIRKYINAMGGLQRLEAIKSLRMKGTHAYRGWEYPLAILRLRPNLFRIEVNYDDRKEVAVFDGESFWEKRDEEAAAKEIQDPRHKHFIEMNLDFDGALVGYKTKGHRVAFAGIEAVDGKKAYKLSLTLHTGQSEAWYFDAATFLLVKRSATTKIRNRDFTQTLYFMDYGKVNGIMVPHYIERVYPPHYVRAYEIHEVEVNPNLETSLFKIAKAN